MTDSGHRPFVGVTMESDLKGRLRVEAAKRNTNMADLARPMIIRGLMALEKEDDPDEISPEAIDWEAVFDRLDDEDWSEARQLDIHNMVKPRTDEDSDEAEPQPAD